MRNLSLRFSPGIFAPPVSYGLHAVMPLTLLEKEVLRKIFAQVFNRQNKIERILSNLAVSDRSFSVDSSDSSLCCGFYLNFSSNSLLGTAAPLPHHLSLQVPHPDIPSGADFVLFLNKSGTGLDFLEATFFEYTISIARIMSADHGFQFGASTAI